MTKRHALSKARVAQLAADIRWSKTAEPIVTEAPFARSTDFGGVLVIELAPWLGWKFWDESVQRLDESERRAADLGLMEWRQ